MSYDWKDFSVVFGAKSDYTFDPKQVETITKSRKELGGQLFFDRIWLSVGLKQPSKHYPPRSNPDLRRLWDTITSSPVADPPKLSLLYYLVLTTKSAKPTSSSTANTTNTIETKFSQHAPLPQKYRLLVTGLWDLDNGHLSRALEKLTDPGISPVTFADEILSVLLNKDVAKAMGFWSCVSPPLENRDTLNKLFDLMVEGNVVEAWDFARALDEIRHKDLFERLIVHVLGQPAGEGRARNVSMVLALPFSHDEEEWFEECLLRGKGRECQHAKDTVLMRRIATGRDISDGGGKASLNRLHGTKVDGVNWDDVRTELRVAEGR